MLQPMAIANWKMNLSRAEAAHYFHTLTQLPPLSRVSVVITPPFTMLDLAGQHLSHSGYQWGAQTLSGWASGAYTGEVSATMLQELGVSVVLIGHSERRLGHHEGAPMLTQQLHQALSAGFTAVYCVGESLSTRQEQTHHQYIDTQLREVITGLCLSDPQQLVIAYEPIWAIGTGVNASPDDAQSMHKMIRHTLADLLGDSMASRIRILYGGSVKPDGVGALMTKSDVNGVLVGGASLDPHTFYRISSMVSEGRS